MTKLYLITCLIIAIFLSPELSFGQKNIGEFNRKEQPIHANIKKEFDAIGFASSWSSDAKTAEEINQYITKAKSIVSKCEERIKSSKNALMNLSEIPSAEIKTNLEYKHWTESIIDEYNTLLKVIRSNIAAAETRKSKAKGNNNQTSSTASTSDDDFWSGNTNSTPDNANGTPDNNTPSAQTARNSDEATKITADFERREADRVHMEGAAVHAVNTTFTNFYAMRAAGQNLKEASTLEGHFDNLEDLDRAFAQKLSEVTQLGQELRDVKVQSAYNQATALASANSTSSADYTAYGQALGGLASIAAGISADKAAQKARDELRKQRDAQEKSIKANQLRALINIREEIGKMFPEGGMPLSSHQIDAPVLYLFAYTSNKSEWQQDKTVPMAVSNVIPVYRYSDDTYPYLSNVKRTFESAGMSSPVIVGYFTDQAMAEKYQQSLLKVSNQGRFLVDHIEIKVKEKDTGKPASAETDFWGNNVKPATNNKEKPAVKKEADNFWNN